MAKIVDHDEKRRTIHEATARIIALEGIDAVTTRRIANESNCALGILSHYFANKNEIVIGALNWCDQRVRDRFGRIVEEEFLTLNDFRNLCVSFLPLDELTDFEWRVRLNLVTYALTNPEMASVRKQSLEFGYEMAANFIRELQEKGEIRKDIDANTMAFTAVDAVFGISTGLLSFPIEERSNKVEAMIDMLSTAVKS